MSRRSFSPATADNRIMATNTIGHRSGSSSPSHSIHHTTSINMATNHYHYHQQQQQQQSRQQGIRTATTTTRTPSPSSRHSPAPSSSTTTTTTTLSAIQQTPSCNFRYVGCYLLIIISDGCDQLRQQSWLRHQTLLSSSNDLSSILLQQKSELEEFNRRWTSGFVAKVIQQIRKGLTIWQSTTGVRDENELKELQSFLDNLDDQQLRNESNADGNGQILLQYAQKSLAVEVLCNPSLLTLSQCLQNVLRSPTGQVQIIYAGATFSETGSWLLADGTFSAYNFYELIEEVDTNYKRSNQNGSNKIYHDISNADNDNGNDPCNGHRSIAEHLSSHDVVVYLHTEPAGEWAILRDIFSRHHIDTHSMTTSITSSLILNDLHHRATATTNTRSATTSSNRYNSKRPSSIVSTSKSVPNITSGQIDNVRRFLFHFALNPEQQDMSPLDTLPDKGAQSLLNYLGDRLAWHFEWLMQPQERGGAGLGNSLASVICTQDPIDTVGFVRLQQPTMYVFPSGQGDCALLSLDSGFTMLLDAGYMPAPRTIWPFIKHLQRLDSIVVTHLGEDNFFGLLSLLTLKSIRQHCHPNVSFGQCPRIGYLFCNDHLSGPQLSPTSLSSESSIDQTSSGIRNEPIVLDDHRISLNELNRQLFQTLNDLKIHPLACIRNIDSLNKETKKESVSSNRDTKSVPLPPTPITLYHKVGVGTLYMYVLNPTLDRILANTISNIGGGRTTVRSSSGRSTPTKQQQELMESEQQNIPEADQQSICSLLIWRPHNPAKRIVRILFPGNCTQAQILEGFQSLMIISKFDQTVSESTTNGSSRLSRRFMPTRKQMNTSNAIPTSLLNERPECKSNLTELLELDMLLHQRTPCTGEQLEQNFKVRYEKTIPTIVSTSSLHQFGRSLSVAPNLLRSRQQKTSATGRATTTTTSKTRQMNSRRSETPSRYSRFRSVSPPTIHQSRIINTESTNIRRQQPITTTALSRTTTRQHQQPTIDHSIVNRQTMTTVQRHTSGHQVSSTHPNTQENRLIGKPPLQSAPPRTNQITSTTKLQPVPPKTKQKPKRITTTMATSGNIDYMNNTNRQIGSSSNRMIDQKISSEEPVPRPVVRRKLIGDQQQSISQQQVSNETLEEKTTKEMENVERPIQLPASSEALSEETSIRSSTDEEVRKITKRMEQQQMKTEAVMRAAAVELAKNEHQHQRDLISTMITDQQQVIQKTSVDYDDDETSVTAATTTNAGQEIIDYETDHDQLDSLTSNDVDNEHFIELLQGSTIKDSHSMELIDQKVVDKGQEIDLQSETLSNKVEQIVDKSNEIVEQETKMTMATKQSKMIEDESQDSESSTEKIEQEIQTETDKSTDHEHSLESEMNKSDVKLEEKHESQLRKEENEEVKDQNNNVTEGEMVEEKIMDVNVIKKKPVEQVPESGTEPKCTATETVIITKTDEKLTNFTDQAFNEEKPGQKVIEQEIIEKVSEAKSDKDEKLNIPDIIEAKKESNSIDQKAETLIDQLESKSTCDEVNDKSKVPELTKSQIETVIESSEQQVSKAPSAEQAEKESESSETADKESLKVESTETEPLKAETTELDSSKFESAETEPAKVDVVQTKEEPPKVEPDIPEQAAVKSTETKQTKDEPAKIELKETEPIKAETTEIVKTKAETNENEEEKNETLKIKTNETVSIEKEPVKVESAQLEPIKAETNIKEPIKVDTAKVESNEMALMQKEQATGESTETEPAKVETKEAVQTKEEPPKVEPHIPEQAAVKSTETKQAKDEPAKIESKEIEPAKAETTEIVKTKAETNENEEEKNKTLKIKTNETVSIEKEPVKVESAQLEPIKAETNIKKPIKVDTVKVEINKTAFMEKEQATAELTETEPTKVETKEEVQTKEEPPKVEPTEPEKVKDEPTEIESIKEDFTKIKPRESGVNKT
nr:microtubule-associated protein 1B-like [Dermatophagoides farinae]